MGHLQKPDLKIAPTRAPRGARVGLHAVIVKGYPPAVAGDPESAMITVEIGGTRV